MRSNLPTCAVLCSLVSATAAAADFDLSWNTIDCGPGAPGFMAGGTFELSATVGQHDAGFMSGGAFELVGGFWGVALSFGVPAPTLVSAVSRKNCDLPIVLSGPTRTSDSRQGGISQVCFSFDDAAPSASLTVEEDATCPSPASYGPYSGAAVATCSPSGNDLCCAFSPALENARAYRITLPSGAGTAQVELRGLLGDVNSDGLVNATDRSTVVGAWTGAGFTCPTDVSDDGFTNATDRSVVVGAWTSAQNCAP